MERLWDIGRGSQPTNQEPTRNQPGTNQKPFRNQPETNQNQAGTNQNQPETNQNQQEEPTRAASLHGTRGLVAMTSA